MKKLILFFSIFFYAGFLKAQNDCNGYFAYKQGTKFELTHYDKKDKVALVLKYEVKKNVSTSTKTDIFYYNETYDNKNKLLSKGDYSIECKNGQVYADVRNISAFAVPKSADMEVDISGDKIIYPHNLNQGQKLPDATMEITGRMSNMSINLMNIKIAFTNRVVEGFEKISTPAGTFDCVKISYQADIKGGLLKSNDRTVEYLAKGVGIVKSETFDKNAKKTSSMLLTKLKN